MYEKIKLTPDGAKIERDFFADEETTPEGGDRILAEDRVIVSNDDMRRLLDYDRKIISGELAEVRHGRWKVEYDEYDNSDGTYSAFRRITCSECKALHYLSTAKLPSFCEDCGAMMDGEEPAEVETACADNEQGTEGGTIAAEGGGIAENRVIAE